MTVTLRAVSEDDRTSSSPDLRRAVRRLTARSRVVAVALRGLSHDHARDVELRDELLALYETMYAETKELEWLLGQIDPAPF